MRAHDYLAYWARVAPDRECVALGDDRWSYADADDHATRVADALRAIGVGPGDRFAVLAKNCPEWLAIYCGASRAGAIPIPLNYRLHPREWIHVLRDGDAQAVIAQAAFAESIDTIRSELRDETRFVTLDEPRERWASLRDLADGRATASPEVGGPSDDGLRDALFIMYTSGTTGRPKGAVLTDRGVVANACQYLPVLPIAAGDRFLLTMPMFHAGPALTCLALIAAGATMQLMADFDAAECVRALVEDDITVAAFVPAMIQRMLDDVPDASRHRYDHLKAMVYGASPITETTLSRAIETFDCGFIQVYGMTEATAVVAALRPEDHRRALDGRPELLQSAGRPLAGTALRVVDAEGRDLPPGEIGEIVVLGPQVMHGYWRLPQETRDTIRDGWLHTGDAGRLDDDGYLYVSGRVNDVIISGGENIHPREVENALAEHPDVGEAAVIGVSDERWGEVVHAVVVAREGSAPNADDIIAFCRGRIAGYKRPRSVDVVDALPRNASGKVLRTELRARYDDARPMPAER